MEIFSLKTQVSGFNHHATALSDSTGTRADRQRPAGRTNDRRGEAGGA